MIPLWFTDIIITTLTHRSLVPYISIDGMGQHWFGNGLSSIQCQAITWTNAALLLIGPLEKLQWNSDWNIKLFIHENAFENWQPFCTGGDELSLEPRIYKKWHSIDKQHALNTRMQDTKYGC